MALMSTKLLNREELSNEKRLPCSLKVLLQGVLLLGCILIIIYLYYGSSSVVQLQSWKQFTEYVFVVWSGAKNGTIFILKTTY